jgi:hypothetical protein
LAQYLELTGTSGAGASGVAGASDNEILMRAAGGGGVTKGAGASGGGAAGADNSARTSWLTISDESWPQAGQTKLTGCDAISGVMSKAYFAPQEHWIFMAGLGFGIQ